MKKVVSVLFITVVTMLLVVGWRWYAYVTNTEKPYDEVGIELNIRMPGPLNAWGCKRLYDTFGNVPAPHGCQSSQGPLVWKVNE
ncbi:hypothetical protein [Sinorhizobium fredii]|uniref:hypothetical protein n=1 Tax=Rhizobium fredii TaxID=380 RepID=UPI00059565C4|nr:hypothetical protein [Sinorhizobium fredii]WOS64692.1 hypothetical protein SFGR64A_24250 [Sinorhizobium fredii GR64]